MDTDTQRREFTPAELLQQAGGRLLTRVRSISYLAENINAYELVSPSGGALPPFAAGSHVDLYFRDGRVRQYSMCNSPAERDRYVIAVQRELAGRGGSIAIFERVHVGRMLVVSEPRNRFPMCADAARHLFVAGGIGIAPIMSMIRALEAAGQEDRFDLYYCTRSHEKTAFAVELARHAAAGRAVFHHDGGDPARSLDFRALLADRRPGTHLYYCGPSGFMAAVADAAAHWPPESVHFEHFTTPDASDEAPGERPPKDDALSTRDVEADRPVSFEVQLARSGVVFEVPEDQSIVQVLRAHGIDVPTSCESGLCGTCRTRYLAGEPEHRDYILDDAERRTDVLICCARSRSPRLVLDL